MSDAKFAALLAFLGVILAPFMALIVKRLGEIKKQVDGAATEQRAEIGKLHAVITQQKAEIAQADKEKVLADVELEIAKQSPAEPKAK